MNISAPIFKIFTSEEWNNFQEQGEFKGSALDMKDGYIHLSDASQVQGTLDKHFKDVQALVLAQINAASLSGALKWEVSRGSAKFPHYYAALKCADIRAHYNLKANEHGRYDVRQIISESR